MQYIRFSDFISCDIVKPSKERQASAKPARPQTRRGGTEMKKNINTMACGCAVIYEENGKVTTSVDQLAKFFRRLSNRSERQAQSRSAVAHA